MIRVASAAIAASFTIRAKRPVSRLNQRFDCKEKESKHIPPPCELTTTLLLFWIDSPLVLLQATALEVGVAVTGIPASFA